MPMPVDRRRRHRRRRHRRDPLHVGHDRHAQGRRAHPRQPQAQLSTIAGQLFDLASDDVALGALPLFHSFGQTCAMNAIDCRRRHALTLIPRFDPGKALEIIQRDQVNVFEGVPTMYGAMLHHPERESFDTSTLKVCASGGSAMPVELMRGFEERVRLQGARGLRPLRDLAGGLVQPPRHGAQAGLDRHAGRRCGDEGGRRRRPRACRRARSARSSSAATT